MTPEDREQKVRDRAYLIWIEHGRPEGRDAEKWLAAEQAVDEEEGAVTPLTSPDLEPAILVPPNR